MNFALAREIIHDHENVYFSENFLVHEDFVSVSHLCNFKMILSNYNEYM